MRRLSFLLVLLVFVSACHKDKSAQNNPPNNNNPVCTGKPFQIAPFIENNEFSCNDSVDYTYIFRKKAQIDSLFPNCGFAGSMAYPISDNNVVYILLGRISYYNHDTFQTKLWKDTCLKTLVYEVNMIQRDTALCRISGVSLSNCGLSNINCSVESIPSNYQVSVKYKYVPK